MCIQEASTLLTQGTGKTPAGRQAGRQVLLLAGQLHNKRFRSANESPVEETEVLFRPCKKAICKQVHNYTPWFTHEPLPHPKILIFLFVLLLFSSFSAHIVLLAL